MHIRTKPNPYKKLDLVVHPQSGKRGIVKEVKGHMVTFEVIFPKPADGAIEEAKCSFKHLNLVMPAAQVVLGAKAIQAKKENTITARLRAAWQRLKNVFNVFNGR